MAVQEQDDAIKYLDDTDLQGRAIRVEKVPQPPSPAITGASPLQTLKLTPLHMPTHPASQAA